MMAPLGTVPAHVHPDAQTAALMLVIDQFTDMLETFERASPKKTLRHGFERLIGSGELKLFCEARSRLLGIGFGTLTTHLAVDKVGWSSLRTFDQSSQTAILRPGSLARRAREHGMTAIAGRERRNGSDRPLIYARSPGDPAIDGLAGLGGGVGPS